MQETKTELEVLCQQLLDANPYMVYNGVTLEHVDENSVGIYTDLKPEYTNIYGMAHGGLLATLLDCCAGLTVRLDGHRYVTLDMNICYFANVSEGRLHTKSEVVKRGKTVSVFRTRVTSDSGKVLAEATVSFFRIG